MIECFMFVLNFQFNNLFGDFFSRRETNEMKYDAKQKKYNKILLELIRNNRLKHRKQKNILYNGNTYVNKKSFRDQVTTSLYI